MILVLCVSRGRMTTTCSILIQGVKPVSIPFAVAVKMGPMFGIFIPRSKDLEVKETSNHPFKEIKRLIKAFLKLQLNGLALIKQHHIK